MAERLGVETVRGRRRITGTTSSPHRLQGVGSRLGGGVSPYLYLLPAFVVYGAFFLLPLYRIVQYSFLKWDGFSEKKWVGLANYERLAHDPLFWQAFRHNIAWMVAGMTVPTIIGLALAIVLVRQPMHGRTYYRAVFFLPQVLASIVVAIIWQWIYSPSSGALDAVLRDVGLGRFQEAWLGSTTWALPAIFLAWAWTAYGLSMVIFIAALQSVDEEYFEAAKIDGASRLQQLRHVLLPFVRRPMTVVILVNAIGALQVFDLVFVITNGGPANATLVLSVYVYQNVFQILDVGYGSANAVALGLAIVIASMLFLRLRAMAERSA
jgi:raffinose/stachyose/melibiose transport system permease protein